MICAIRRWGMGGAGALGYLFATVIGAAPTEGRSYTVLHSFGGGLDGSDSQASLIRDAAGNLYGTTERGGDNDSGVVFKLDTTGERTVLYSFTGGVDGGGPTAGLIQDSAGNLYGVAKNGGSTGYGVVFKLDTAGKETVLHSFMGVDGANPRAGLLRNSSGTLYGTTIRGGTWDRGVVYKLDQNGEEAVLYSFTGLADGAEPFGNLVADPAGNLYGTTFTGGAGFGVVFKLDASDNRTVLYSFTGLTDGGGPLAGVIRDSAGNLYGTTSYGGVCGIYCGVVYKLDTAGRETVLHNFAASPDGLLPKGSLIQDAAGNLYGTAAKGGMHNYGAVFKLDVTGQETVLYSFSGGPDGANPGAGLILDSGGNLYGTTISTVFELDSMGRETVLHELKGPRGGQLPRAGLVRDSGGNLYGTTSKGGKYGWGLVFKVDASGQETELYSFTGGADGGNPMAGVILDSAGNIYGTTYNGGPGGGACYGGYCGVVFKLDASGHESVLHSFTGGMDGASPVAGVALDSAGNLYGITSQGGGGACFDGCGVIFKLAATGQETVLYSFTGGADGGSPAGGLIRDPAGILYGTTNAGGKFNGGVVFKLDNSGNQTVLYSFTYGADGATPNTTLLRDAEGNLYGTTYFGGQMGGVCPTEGCGVVYRLDATGHETVLHRFAGGVDGANSDAALVQDPAGDLYGTTFSGGKSNDKVVFKLTLAGEETVLHEFRGEVDGATPESGVILDEAGNLYGTTLRGGRSENGCDCGVVFKLTP